MCIFNNFTYTALATATVSTDFVTHDPRVYHPRFLPDGNYDRLFKIGGSYVVRTAGTDSWFFLHECGAHTGLFTQTSEFTGYIPTVSGHRLVFGDTVVSF